ncbi:hypothetical protein PENSPDRAFT_638914 [Peniophora sp. CONT]|nr:hypothetical protein PENSPDRAFT_638914 [Peniophora sp. CONT]
MLSALPEDVTQEDLDVDSVEAHLRDRNTWHRTINVSEVHSYPTRRTRLPRAASTGPEGSSSGRVGRHLVDAATRDGLEAIAQAGYEAFANGDCLHQLDERRISPETEREGSGRITARRRRRENVQPDTAKTVQRVVLGSIVTFGAGLEIRGFTTGFESCTIRINGLPADVLEREIYELFTQQGIDEARLYLMSHKILADGTSEAKMVMDAESGEVLSVGLDDLDFRGSRLSFEVGTYNIPGKMGASAVKDTNILTISCPAASLRYVLTYASEDLAQDKCRELDGLIHRNRRLKAEYVQTSVAESDERSGIRQYALKLSNLPKPTTYDHVRALAGSEVLSYSPLALKGVPSTDIALEAIRESVYSSKCRKSDIYSFESPDVADLLNGTITVRVCFSSWDVAKSVHDHIRGRKLACLGNKAFQVFLPSPLSYTITIPSQQHDAQRAQWNEIRRESHAGDKALSCLTRLQVPGKSLVRLRVTGSDNKAVGALKLRVESLAAGERVVGWHPRLLQHDGVFFDRVLAETGAFLRADRRQRQIKVYGSADTTARARALVENEFARLSSLDFRTQVPPLSVRSFLAQGLQELCELLGEENVHFDPSTRVLTTSGGDDARHIVSRVVKRTMRGSALIPYDGADACPICFDVVRAPLLLPCGHAYCSSCLRHFVNSAADSDKFPLACMGNEARCNAPIPIPIFERFLPQPALVQLLEAAFFAYVSQHPQTLKFCRTPDCEQIYRAVPLLRTGPSPVQCPACLTVICPACHEDSHESMTCEESLLRSDPTRHERLVDEWIASQDGRVKRCPQCRVPIEKTEGCNHMECKCGAHVCWTCLGTFSAHDIYTHMRAIHGGIHDHVLNAAEPAPAPALPAPRALRPALPERLPVADALFNHNEGLFVGQHPLLDFGNAELMQRHQRARLRREEFDAENLRLRERFLAAEAERQRRQETGAADQDRRPLTRLFRRIL